MLHVINCGSVRFIALRYGRLFGLWLFRIIVVGVVVLIAFQELQTARFPLLP